MALEDQIARLQEHNRRCAIRIKNQRAEIQRLLAELASRRDAREALHMLRGDLENVPHTVDGVIARPGLWVWGDWGTAKVHKVFRDSQSGQYAVEIEDSTGPQGWVPLNKCWSMPF